MGFFDDLTAVGINPMNRKFSSEQQYTNTLATILYAISSPELLTDPMDPQKNEQLGREMALILDEYQSGTIGPDWLGRATNGIQKAYGVFDERGYFKSAEAGESFERMYDQKAGEVRETFANSRVTISEAPKKEEMQAQAPTPAQPKQTAASSGTKGSLITGEEDRQNLVEISLKGMGLLDPKGTDFTRIGFDPDEMAPYVSAMADMFDARLDAGVKRDLDALKKEFFTDKNVGLEWIKRAGETMEQAYSLGYQRGDFRNPSTGQQFVRTALEAKAAIRPGEVRINIGNGIERKLVEGQMKKVDQILDVREKIQAESQGLHKDSKEYKAMRESVEKVYQLVASGAYDPQKKGGRAVAEMEKALKEVEEASKAYAKKEAFKEKSTSRGVERKNTALYLMDILDPSSTQAFRDGQQKLKDSRLIKNGQKKFSFKELMDLEKTRNSQIAQSERQKRQNAQLFAQKRKKGKAAAQDPSLFK